MLSPTLTREWDAIGPLGRCSLTAQAGCDGLRTPIGRSRRDPGPAAAGGRPRRGRAPRAAPRRPRGALLRPGGSRSASRSTVRPEASVTVARSSTVASAFAAHVRDQGRQVAALGQLLGELLRGHPGLLGPAMTCSVSSASDDAELLLVGDRVEDELGLHRGLRVAPTSASNSSRSCPRPRYVSRSRPAPRAGGRCRAGATRSRLEQPLRQRHLGVLQQRAPAPCPGPAPPAPAPCTRPEPLAHVRARTRPACRTRWPSGRTRRPARAVPSP